jgi:hypothetical protein
MGGRTGRCHPAGIERLSKISLIEASHFDPAVAAAVDVTPRRSDYIYHARLRVTWQRITDGITPGILRATFAKTLGQRAPFAGTESGLRVF